MGFVNKIIGGVLIFFTLLLIFRDWVLVPIGIFIVIVIIRLLADLFWKGKDDGWW